ncbi:hypothetical protein AB0K02_32810 [Streptomyces sp. NPDC049597]
MRELWLLPAAGGEGSRISRVLDDVWDKEGPSVHPQPRAEGGPASTLPHG